MLEKKLKKDLDAVNAVMEAGEIRSTDVSKDVMRSMVKGCTSFENTFDNLIEAGKKEVDNETPKTGKKEKIKMPLGSLDNVPAFTCK